jgi:hypothetical protein
MMTFAFFPLAQAQGQRVFLILVGLAGAGICATLLLARRARSGSPPTAEAAADSESDLPAWLWELSEDQSRLTNDELALVFDEERPDLRRLM